MKRLLVAPLAALALTTGPALAADLSRPAPVYKASPPPPPAVSWTGCYIDGGVGFGMWKEDHYGETFPGLVQVSATTTTGGDGWLGRLGAGCDYQVVSRFVIGAFGDYDFMHFHGTFADAAFGPISGDENESAAWGLGGRIGYLVTLSLLTYLDGGYTQARFDQINFNTGFPPTPSGFDIAAHTYHGWFLGGGTEYALSGIIAISGLFWRTEYRYASYQAADLPVLVTATGLPTTGAAHMRPTVQTITTGLVWRFNFSGPIATKY